MSDEAYDRLIALLDSHGAHYRLIDHEPEGRTEIVSAMRGHDPSHAAKCMILMVKIGKKQTKWLLAVVPGHRRVSFAAVKELYGATHVAIAPKENAERLGGSASGTILPFSFNSELEVVADPSLFDSEELYFNAARLDRSIALRSGDYRDVAKPQVTRIAE